jgi:predicted transcriptional regulator
MTTVAPPQTRQDDGGIEALDTPRAKLVYLALLQTEARTADDLSALLDLQKITLFDVLSTLDDKGLIEREGQRCAPVASERRING